MLKLSINNNKFAALLAVAAVSLIKGGEFNLLKR